MRDSAWRIILGFVMVQLFPGAALLYALSFFYFSLPPTVSPNLYQEFNVVLAAWDTGSMIRGLVVFAMCAGTGLFIQGWQRSVAGAVESRFGSVARSYGCDRAIWIQVLLGPVNMVREGVDLLFRTKTIRDGAAKSSGLDPSRDGYTAEFFLNTAHAGLGCFVALATFLAFGGVSLRRALLLALVWCASGLFFALGRFLIQTSGAGDPGSPAS